MPMFVTVYTWRSKDNFVVSVLFSTFILNTEVNFPQSLCDQQCSYSDFLKKKIKYLMMLIAYNIFYTSSKIYKLKKLKFETRGKH